jgi:hypothetical protein
MNRHGRISRTLRYGLFTFALVLLGVEAVVAARDSWVMPDSAPKAAAAQAPHDAIYAIGPAHPWPNRPEIDATQEITSPSLSYVTLPDGFPHLLVPTSTLAVETGYLFFSAYAEQRYLMIVDNTGDPIYYKVGADGTRLSDFKRLDVGVLSYSDQATDQVILMDSTYTPIRTIKPGNGYTELDGHDHLLLSNGNMLIEVLETRIVDMSEVVPGGHPSAEVTAQILQEIDASDNVVWEWNSWDHYAITDASVDLTQDRLTFVHINSMEEDQDGNIIISARRQDEVTKINRATGEIIWRLGGRNNDFQLVGGGQWFVAQHDARRLPNGNLTVYDNRCSPRRPGTCTSYSRAVEYELDEKNMLATQVWEYWNDGQAIATGSTRRMENGNTLIGWGASNFGATEVEPSGDVAFEAAFVGNTRDPVRTDDAITSYRVVRHTWKGCPAEPPTLVAQYDRESDSISLHYSWNGATSVTGYEVYGGSALDQLTPISTKQKTRFEEATTIEGPSLGVHHFRVLPLTSDNCPARYSNEVSVCVGSCQYLPSVSRSP